LPGAVGFSEGPEDKIITDDVFTKDAINTLRLFFARFPSYKKNDLFLSGHGYGAVHVTYLAKAIV
jgi:carboxypeptidase C (cathepsin A)